MTNIQKKNLGGRPKALLSNEQIEEVETLAKFLTVEQIADHFGIGESTFLQIRQRQPEVSLAYKKGKSKAISFVASKLMEKILNGDTAATIFFLKTQAGWSEKQHMDIRTNSNISLPAIILKSNSRAKDGV